jgi:cytochrome P450
MKEAMRWLPPSPTGVPHATTEEDEYRGWRIPKGSIVIANAWKMLHDENIYPDPTVFRPERFLASEEKVQEPDPGITGAFGFGRRYVV